MHATYAPYVAACAKDLNVLPWLLNVISYFAMGSFFQRTHGDSPREGACIVYCKKNVACSICFNNAKNAHHAHM